VRPARTSGRGVERKKEMRRARIAAALDSIVGQLELMGARKVIPFGSLARGDVDAGSVLDLLVLMPPERSGKEWTSLIYGSVSRKIAADILVFTEEELRQNLPASGLLRNIVDTGMVIYEKKQGGGSSPMADSCARWIQRRR
jgi:predicted nucleotidyltransferase